ncbi:Reverse transcriptase-like [Sesbania bispinosa]|nr:Reverse transcriptase-like [Sesbania bispinosa]
MLSKSGLPLETAAGWNPKVLPLAAKALAIREAAMLAYNLNWERVIFESDNLPLIEACRGERRIAEIELILLDIQTLVVGLVVSGFT